ncbi:hypothetical protein SAG0163_09625 [Streptococcus agalactiae MRI Z1-215]|nr:hypothetical protein SAG0163_09625 [Streptococcus agalactiae MRI Z1-215]KKF48768.1 hypothetical protein AF59_04450 [Streptococcus uberis C5072]KKF60670.1 hypothetical protein AF69_09830 [Streptococcus uberis 6736]KKF62471.1 hypothetical protein AF58_04380 [Streptococcus uberis C6344]
MIIDSHYWNILKQNKNFILTIKKNKRFQGKINDRVNGDVIKKA